VGKHILSARVKGVWKKSVLIQTDQTILIPSCSAMPNVETHSTVLAERVSNASAPVVNLIPVNNAKRWGAKQKRIVVRIINVTKSSIPWWDPTEVLLNAMRIVEILTIVMKISARKLRGTADNTTLFPLYPIYATII
jgi:hypothetical protein